MRFKQHETSVDLGNEQTIARVLESAWQCDLHKIPKQYRLDFMATRGGKPVSFVEVKRRHQDRLKYDTLILSLSKIIHARELTETTGLPCFFAVEFDDCIAYTELRTGFPIVWGGRTVRTRDSRDFEPVVNIPTHEMRIIE